MKTDRCVCALAVAVRLTSDTIGWAVRFIDQRRWTAFWRRQAANGRLSMPVDATIEIGVAKRNVYGLSDAQLVHVPNIPVVARVA